MVRTTTSTATVLLLPVDYYHRHCYRHRFWFFAFFSLVTNKASCCAMQTHADVRQTEEGLIHQQAVLQTVQILASVLSHDKQRQLLQYTEQVKLLWNAIKYNAFSVTDSVDDEPVGIALYKPPAHSINHSCAPNAVQNFLISQPGQPPRLFIRVIRKVASGEEVTIRYLPEKSGQSRVERRQELYDQYNFWCNCEACATE
jgi:hypothetical protein